MRFYQKYLVGLLVSTSLLVLVLLPPFVNSAHEQMKPALLSNDSTNKHRIQKLNDRQLVFQIKVHGFLLWASMGFLVPVGILVIRVMSNRQVIGGRKIKILFNLHVSLQILSVVFATTAAILSFKNFGNTFNNNHQMVGLVLYCTIWMQALIGFCKPDRGTNGSRSIWFLVHWAFGTVLCILGVINIYTGLRAYQKRTSKSIWIWTLLFTIEISSLAFLYLLQDKWEYLQKQGVILRDEPAITPTDDHEVPPSPRGNNHKEQELIVPPC